MRLNLGPPYGQVEMTPQLLEALVEAVDQTRATGLEHAFPLCLSASGQELSPGEPCVGTKCSIRPSEKCGPRMLVGGLHTHPEGSSAPSAADLGYAHYHSTQDYPYVDCRTGQADVRCDSPSFLATTPTRVRLDTLLRRVEGFYAEWEKTGIQPEDGSRQAYEDALHLLGRAFDKVDDFPMDAARSLLQHHLEQTTCPAIAETAGHLEEGARMSVHNLLWSAPDKEAKRLRCRGLENDRADLESMMLRADELKDIEPKCQEAHDRVKRASDTVEGLMKMLLCRD